MLLHQRAGRLFAALILLVAATSAVTAQLPALSPPTNQAETKKTAPVPEPIAAKRADNAELLRIAQRKLEVAGTNDSAAVQEAALYQSLDSVLAQHEAVDQQIKDLTARRAEFETAVQAAKVQNAKDSQPPTFADLDRLKDDLATEEARARLVDDKLATATTALETAEQTFNDYERVRRQAEEAADAGKEQPDGPQLAAAAEQARQSAKLASEVAALRKLQVTREELARDIQKLAIQICEEKISRTRPLVIFSEADYDAQIDKIKQQEDAANAALAKSQFALQIADGQLKDAQTQFEAESGERTLSSEKLESCRRTQERLSADIDSQTQKLQRLAQLRVAWSRRFKMPSAEFTAKDKETYDLVKSWYKEVKRDLAELERDTRGQILRMRDLRNLMSTATKKVEAGKDGPPVLLVWIERQRTELEVTLRIHEANLVAIETCRRVHEKLYDEVYDTLPDVSPRNIAWDAWNQVLQLSSAEIAVIDDKQITVGKVIQCIIVFIVGLMLARFLAAVFANRFLKRFKLSKDGTAAVRSLVFYALLAIVTVHVLDILKVPLTAFTILGGSLAIGVGFGSQTLINNFIGGLIMLAERPVRLGERIIFGNFDGVVEEVGFRCTRLRTASDHIITIPNSTLVNDSIENTARRRTIRRVMNIAISYETPRDRIVAAVQAIRDILAEPDTRERIHPIVGFEELRPQVHFNDFNTDSLNIQVVYWYGPPEGSAYMEHTERVNHRIMEEFERLGVEFANPSRNVYLVGDTNLRLGRISAA